MKIVAFFVIVTSIVIISYFLFGTRKVEAADISFYRISISDVPIIYRQLLETGSNISYATFVFFSSDPNEESHLEIQFSIENDQIGFDWVFLGDIKDRHKDAFIDLLQKYNYAYSNNEMNGVKYIRVVDGDLVQLCQKVMSEMYGVQQDSFMELIAARFRAEGFPLSTS